MKIVMAGGCFNRIHEGHKFFLGKAKKLGDYLIVVITHDVHNKKANAVVQKQRKKNVEELGIADEVVIGNPEDFMKVVHKYKPVIVAIGYDQNMPFLDDVKKLGIEIVRIRKCGK